MLLDARGFFNARGGAGRDVKVKLKFGIEILPLVKQTVFLILFFRGQEED